MLCWPIFNYPKFYIISHFVQYICDYGSAINYNTAYNKAAHKYFLEAFYNRSNKKEYKLQIWQHNVGHINIITIKDVIILEKIREKKKLLEALVDKTTPARVAWALSPVDLAWKEG